MSAYKQTNTQTYKKHGRGDD